MAVSAWSPRVLGRISNFFHNSPMIGALGLVSFTATRNSCQNSAGKLPSPITSSRQPAAPRRSHRRPMALGVS